MKKSDSEVLLREIPTLPHIGAKEKESIKDLKEGDNGKLMKKYSST